MVLRKFGSNQVQSKGNSGSIPGWTLQLRKKKSNPVYWVLSEENVATGGGGFYGT